MSIPNWYGLILLSLAAWRIFQLVSDDEILDWPRRKLLRLSAEWEAEGDPTGPKYREKMGLFLMCPYCAGFWIALGWWVAYQLWEHGTLVVAVPFAISAGVVAAAKVLSPE